MYNLIEDMSKLTTISTRALSQLSDKAIYCIVDAIKEDSLQNKDITEIDIGIGKLAIKKDNVSVKYRFEPSAELIENIRALLQNGLNLLEVQIEKNLVDNISNPYKNLFQ